MWIAFLTLRSLIYMQGYWSLIISFISSKIFTDKIKTSSLQTPKKAGEAKIHHFSLCFRQYFHGYKEHRLQISLKPMVDLRPHTRFCSKPPSWSSNLLYNLNSSSKIAVLPLGRQQAIDLNHCTAGKGLTKSVRKYTVHRLSCVWGNSLGRKL